MRASTGKGLRKASATLRATQRFLPEVTAAQEDAGLRLTCSRLIRLKREWLVTASRGHLHMEVLGGLQSWWLCASTPTAWPAV